MRVPRATGGRRYASFLEGDGPGLPAIRFAPAHFARNWMTD